MFSTTVATFFMHRQHSGRVLPSRCMPPSFATSSCPERQTTSPCFGGFTLMEKAAALREGERRGMEGPRKLNRRGSAEPMGPCYVRR